MFHVKHYAQLAACSIHVLHSILEPVNGDCVPASIDVRDELRNRRE
jgi:hypothetical protein